MTRLTTSRRMSRQLAVAAQIARAVRNKGRKVDLEKE
jgi:hypothetical protein